MKKIRLDIEPVSIYWIVDQITSTRTLKRIKYGIERASKEFNELGFILDDCLLDYVVNKISEVDNDG